MRASDVNWQVAAVRPYSRRIRSRVFRILDDLGAEVQTVAPAGEPDLATIEAVRRSAANVLLVPFHAHKDRHGQLVHGLDVIRAVRQRVPRHAATPVICPISRVGMAAAGLLSSRIDEPLDPLLLLEEEHLSAADLPARIERFLRAHARG